MTSAPETGSAQISDSRGYFSTPSLKGLVQQLSHLAFFGDGLSLVLGSKGSGKTVLCGELTQNLSQADDTVSIVLTSNFDLAECIEQVLEALGLENSEPLTVGEMLAQLRHYVQALAQDKKLVTLIIDDAHFLDDQAIGALISLLQGRSDANVGLHLILLSEPGLDQRIDALQIIDVPVYDFDMPNLSPSELARFLEQYHPDTEALSSPQLQKIWASSHGIPGVALALVDESGAAASDTASEDMANRRSPVPYAHIVAIGLLGLALIWSLLLSRGDNDSSDTASVTKIAIGPSVPAKGVTEDKKQLVNNQDKKSQTTIPTPEVTPIAMSTGSASQELSEVDTDDIARAKQEKAASAENLAKQQSQPGITVVNNEQKAAESGVANTENDASKTSEDKTSVDNTQATTVSPPTAKPIVKAIPKSTFDLTKSEAFLMQQNPNSYTLQVVAASGRSSLEAYIKRQVNSGSLQMYRSVSKRKNWFIVVQGVYSSREEALKGIKSLPKEQSKAGPWPRKISAIQQEIDAFKRK